jgi:broad specificity phosphatase PhoE
VRHGETEGESSIRYYGRTDVPLSQLGRAQMQRVRSTLISQSFLAAYSSTLSRSAEAALIVTGGALPVTRLAGFDEIDFGEWEGLTAEQIRELQPALYAQWQERRGEFAYPGGESSRDFHARVARTLRRVLAQASPGELLFVLHKGVIRSIVSELLGVDEVHRRRLSVALGSIHILARDHEAWYAEALDCVGHL